MASKTITEQLWLDTVAKQPCALCQTRPVEIHHIRTGQGMSQRASHFLVIGLCPDCHRGPMGIHGDQTYLKVHKTDELKLLSMTIERAVKALASV